MPLLGMSLGRFVVAMRSDLEALISSWRQQAADRLRASKAYKCRSMDGERSGLVKGAAALMQAADQVEAILNRASALDSGPDVVQNAEP